MCMEDIKIGRKSNLSTGFVVVPPFTNIQLCQRNLRRTSLILSFYGGTIGYFWIAPIVGGGPALHFVSPFTTISLTLKDYGEIVTSEWWHFADSIQNNVVFMETTIAEDMEKPNILTAPEEQHDPAKSNVTSEITRIKSLIGKPTKGLPAVRISR